MAKTLWSTESPTRDLRSSDDYKSVNVQVVLRCRPMSEDEIKTRTPLVISCDEIKQEVTAIQNTGNKQKIDKTFVFDKVFAPTSQQKDLYDNVVARVVNEVLEGYSWTIFAYGQTGTGKTYTMEGEARKEKNGQLHKNAGVIPRAVQQIFDILENQKADYTMKVTFLELYNEEITDLLAPEEGSNFLNDKPKKPLILMEDGKGAVFVRGLEEEIVCSADEIYAILHKGSAKKHTADTLLNKQSNRSHSIFSITVQIKESSSDGSELIRCGKLNLVDLAGSENILRSGAREERAREAGEINKSLLTLGRVINALAENSVHVNQQVLKSPLVKDLYAQIDRLKQELFTTRAKNDIYASQENQHDEAATRKELMELQELYNYQQQLTVDLKDKLENTQKELTMTRQSLSNLEDQYRQTKDMHNDKETMISNILCSGKALTERALELRSDLEGAASDVTTLLARIEHKNSLEDKNRHNIQNFYSQLAQQLQELDKAVSASVIHQEQNWKAIQNDTESFLASKTTAMDELLKQIQIQQDLYASGVNRLDDSAEELYKQSRLALSGLSSELSTHSSSIMECTGFSDAQLVKKSSSEADTMNNGLKTNLNNLGSRIHAFLQQQHEEFSLGEERLLLEQMAELLASSRSRKQKLASISMQKLSWKDIQASIDDILESACKRTDNLNQETSNVQDLTADAEEKWTNYINRTESNYVENSASLEAGKCTLEEGLECCITKSTEVSEQWRASEESLLHLIKQNVESVDSFINNGTEDSEKIRIRFSSVASSVLEETDDARKNILLSAEYPLRLDHEASEKIDLLSARCLEDLKDINIIHSGKVDEITRTARISLLDDYLVRGHIFLVLNMLGCLFFKGNGLVTYYSRCDDLVSARALFDEMPERDLVSWNSMISGYSQGGFYQECKDLYRAMLGLRDLMPDGVTAVSVLHACAQSTDLVFGVEVHQYVIDNGIKVDLSVCNSIISVYAKCGSLDYAKELFEEMTEKDEITYSTIISGYMVHGFVDEAMKIFREMRNPGLSTWNAVISGSVQNNQYDNVLDLVRQMQVFGFKPNSVTLSSILPSIPYVSHLKGAKEIHARAIKINSDKNIYVVTAIIDTYAKLGYLSGAQRVFNLAKNRSVIVWTAIISAYASHGDANAALSLFNEMLNTNTKPDAVTFTAVLAACAHSGLVDEAWEIFHSLLPKYEIQPLVNHYACMVACLSRAGKLFEAVEFVKKMPIEPTAQVWGALLSGASDSGDVELAEFVCDHLFELEPGNPSNYIVMANLYSKAGRWEEAERVREILENSGFKKVAGSSRIETSGGFQSFLGGDATNERTNKKL
ncbi:hypothetical protein DH2020_015063 [Rehmannia glutinosa]|uniref:Kinesin motor domain-containing protein n=1 Tax=Rehmannia glutinosa TaxID=99300 RepID=A0ABR0WY90_REHGL